MESPSSAIPAGDGIAANSHVEEKIAEPHPLENGWHGYEYMKNGKPRPSAVRDFPEGIFPLHCKQISIHKLSPSSEEKNQLQKSPTISRGGKIEEKQTDETGSASAAEGVLDVDSGKETEAIRSTSEPHTDLRPEKALTYTSKKSKAVQGENKRPTLASPDAVKQNNGKAIVAKKNVLVEDKVDNKKVTSTEKMENASAKSSKSVERKTTSPDLNTAKQEAQAKSIKVKVPSLETTQKKVKSGKLLQKKVLALGKPVENKGSATASSVSNALPSEEEVRADLEESISMDKTHKMPTAAVQETEKAEVDVSQAQIEAMDVEMQQGEEMGAKKVVQQPEEEMVEQSKKAQSVKRKSGIRDLPEPLTKQAMNVEKQQEVETAENAIGQLEEETAVEKVEEPSKKAQPAKRKSGVRDLPESSTVQAKKKVAKEGTGLEHIAPEMEVSPSNAKETVKVNAVVIKEKLSGNAKLPKLKPTHAQTPVKAKEKVLNSKTQGQVVTPKSTNKSSTPSESSKKVRRSSAGKAVRPATSTTDVSNARELVLESLRLYDAVRRKFVQDEEKNGKQGRGSRADLLTATLLKDQNASRVVERGHGSLPGVLVGDIFLFRTELSFARVHGPIQGGIEYLTTKDSEFNTPVAISIISNVGQDGEDNGEELIYTGQGGRSADNKQIAAQKLERGNLAMDGSRKFKIPVRVIRGIKDANSPTGKVYVYDGLYNVLETDTAKGSGGFDEFKFRLQRVPDQPELGSDTLKLAADLKSQALPSRKDVVIVDISKGLESQAICVENTVDDDKGPAEFKYSTKVIYPDDLGKLESSMGCKCNGACTPSSKCSCFTRNGDELPYLNGGYLVRQKDFILECGSKCSCSSSCRNRASEKGLKFRLDIFKTANRGWGVRSLEMIPAGSFVCDYVGKVVADEHDVKEVSDRTHMLFTRWLPETTPRWGDVPSIIPDRPSSTIMPDAGKPELVIDATHVGNVARFINHSCSPNLIVQKVLSGHQDVNYPQFKLFAGDNIPPLKELTFDYGYPPDQEPGLEEIECLCGSFNCRGKLYV